MIVFLKNTIHHINTEIQQGKPVLARAEQASAPAAADQTVPLKQKQVDAVTGGTQGISHYYARQHLHPIFPKPEKK